MTDRSRYIGGTDAAPILGVSRWRTPLDVWQEKVGEPREATIETERMALGRALEDAVLDLFEARTGVALVVRHGERIDAAHPFLGGHPDGETADANVDAKVAWDPRPWLLDEGRRRVPMDYLLQGLHYAMLSGKPTTHFAVLMAGNAARYETISVTFTPDDIADLRARLVAFWTEYVVPRVEPPIDGSRAASQRLARLYPRAELSTVVATPEIAVVAERLRLIRSAGKWLDDQRAEAENKIKAYMREHDRLDGDGWSVTWRNDADRTVTDWQAVAAAYAAALDSFVAAGVTATPAGVDIRNMIEATTSLHSIVRAGTRRFLPKFKETHDGDPIRTLAGADDGAVRGRLAIGVGEPASDADRDPR